LTQYYTAEKDGSDRAELEAASAALPLSARSSDKYALGEDVGQGGMKRILRATDRDARREIALATIREGHAAPEAVRRFVREARITALLEHPNIVPVHDVGVDADGKPFFTMKLLRGESLSNVIKSLSEGDDHHRRTFGLQTMVEIFRDVCSAIAFAHSKGVVHLDLKPANIQVGAYGEALVIDWGLAKLTTEHDAEYDELVAMLEEPDAANTAYGAIKGTPGFMAPEQARGDNSDKDERTDIYALGAILYSMLTWKRPIDKPSADEVREATLKGELVPPSQRAPDRFVPPALELVVMKAMALDPARRYNSVEDLSRDIQAYTQGFAVSAQDPSFLTLFWLLVKRHKIGSLLTLVAVIVIVLVSAVSISEIRKGERKAVAAFDQLVREQSEKQRYGLLAAPRILARASLHYGEGRFDEAIEELNLAVTLDPDNQDAWLYKGWYHLGTAEFAAAAASFERGSEKEKRYRNIAAECRLWERLWERDEESPLSTDHADRLLTMVKDSTPRRAPRAYEKVRSGLIIQLLSGKACRNASLGVRMEFLRSQLRFSNSDARKVRLKYDGNEDALQLDLSGNPMLKHISILRGLPLVSLDLSDTGVIWLGALEGMDLEFLDISGSRVDNLEPIQGMPLKILRMRDMPDLEVDQDDFPQLEQLVR